ncbi:mycofactocin system transcriptional regulator [Amnibacterium endophyticum]|uniref:Mycofactocin system transcriptional regulator n=1 Tax=Amnibacterium endophyticum TaxID=2109337 RepID=A0ABW4LI23_9MICO
MSPENTPDQPRGGRAPVTTKAQLGHVGLQLFFERGFERTTVDDIAAAAGIGRRTFFRYFASKNDLPWGDFDGLVEAMRVRLASVPQDVPPLAALREAVLAFNRFPDVADEDHRRRMTLLLGTPELIAHSTLRFADWRRAVADFVADRLGEDPGGLRPQTIAWTYLAASIAAYERWLVDGTSLQDLLAEAMDLIEGAFRP